MKHSKEELDAIIEDAARGIREDRIDSSVIDQSAARVWARVSRQMSGENAAASISSAENTNIMNSNNSAEQIRGCADFPACSCEH